MSKLGFLLVLRFPVWRRRFVHVVVSLPEPRSSRPAELTSADYLRNISDTGRRVYRVACGASRAM
jgi:hypothetical protein